MPNVGWGEMMILMVVVLIVFGPNRLPEMARNIGKFVRNFQRETSNALAELKEGIEPVKIGVFDEPDRPAGANPTLLQVEPAAEIPPGATPATVATAPKRPRSAPARATTPARKAPARRSAARETAARGTVARGTAARGTAARAKPPATKGRAPAPKPRAARRAK
jgi:Tat protein translocase TatB subunit